MLGRSCAFILDPRTEPSSEWFCETLKFESRLFLQLVVVKADQYRRSSYNINLAFTITSCNFWKFFISFVFAIDFQNVSPAGDSS